MRFLEKIDLIHESNRKNLNIPKENREFTSHIPITISVGEVSYGFEIRKKEKSKLLLSSGKQRIYLSDFDIINIILNMSREPVFLHPSTRSPCATYCASTVGIGLSPVRGLDSLTDTLPSWPAGISIK